MVKCLGILVSCRAFVQRRGVHFKKNLNSIGGPLVTRAGKWFSIVTLDFQQGNFGDTCTNDEAPQNSKAQAPSKKRTI